MKNNGTITLIKANRGPGTVLSSLNIPSHFLFIIRSHLYLGFTDGETGSDKLSGLSFE